MIGYVPAKILAPAAIVASMAVPSIDTLSGENPTLSAAGRLLADSTAISEYSEDVTYVSDATVLCALQTV